MPIKSYYGGTGEAVMKKMKKQYGDKKGERVFYATENKKKSLKDRVKERRAEK